MFNKICIYLSEKQILQKINRIVNKKASAQIFIVKKRILCRVFFLIQISMD